jgi:hypothetical protein
MKKQNGENKIEKELRQIRNLLILAALKSGATSTEVDYATGMGRDNISRMFPVKRGKRTEKKGKQ